MKSLWLLVVWIPHIFWILTLCLMYNLEVLSAILYILSFHSVDILCYNSFLDNTISFDYFWFYLLWFWGFCLNESLIRMMSYNIIPGLFFYNNFIISGFTLKYLTYFLTSFYSFLYESCFPFIKQIFPCFATITFFLFWTLLNANI